MSSLWISLDSDELTAAQVAAVQEAAPGMTLGVGRDLDSAGLIPTEVEIATGWLDAGAILGLPALRWAQHWAAGVERFTGDPEIVAKDFVLTNGSGIHAIPITEHILGMLLAFARGLHGAIRQQATHTWGKADTPANPGVFELAGKTMVLVGVGAIGAHTAQTAAALGMHVIGIRRDPSVASPGVSRMVPPEELLDVLPEADCVVITVPLTPATRRMIGERELRAMKPTTLIVNIGRGGTIDETALIRALREGRIGGAGLDVFETEPLPAGSPLWDMENVIITSHYAGHTPNYTERALGLFLDGLRRYRAGEPLVNVVDMGKGY